MGPKTKKGPTQKNGRPNTMNRQITNEPPNNEHKHSFFMLHELIGAWELYCFNPSLYLIRPFLFFKIDFWSNYPKPISERFFLHCITYNVRTFRTVENLRLWNFREWKFSKLSKMIWKSGNISFALIKKTIKSKWIRINKRKNKSSSIKENVLTEIHF